jgi:nitrogen fixation/metabolism regulation signal transduction histidine kinase
VSARSQYPLISTRGLIFVYILLLVLTVLFTRSFFWETLYEGQVPDALSITVFFSAPAVLLVFIFIAAGNLVFDIATGKPGIKFRVRLLVYFIVTVVFAVTPIIIVTSISINEIVRFWHSVNSDVARDASRSFAVENFSFHVGKFEDIITGTNWNAVMADAPDQIESGGFIAPEKLPGGIACVQDLVLSEGRWQEAAFLGDITGRLSLPPSQSEGFPVRELPRDAGFIRYVMPGAGNMLRVISYDLGSNFELGVIAIENQAERFNVIGIMRDNVRILEFFYYAVFFLPPLLMTMIIAISFTRRITSPIAELTEATGRVASGDFSVQILSRRGDELGLLIRAFNSMVRDLEKSRAALVKAEKISIWQNMAQQLAHEIKNPLTPIKLSAERVLRRWRNEPENVGNIIEDSMLAIIQETEGLTTLLNEFRTLSRPMELSLSSIKFGDALGEAIAPYQNSYPNIAFDTSYVTGDITVKIDQSRFSRILANLVINSIDAMNASGSIEIRTDVVKKKDVKYCRISIKDSGKGISKEEAEKIFTPYFTTKESGTGLGLPIVERIVNEHGGSIWFNSQEGMGTVFFIDLPVADSDSDDDNGGSAKVEVGNGNNSGN